MKTKEKTPPYDANLKEENTLPNHVASISLFNNINKIFEEAGQKHFKKQ